MIEGALRAAGLDAHALDANLSQAHSFLTVALGGVRVVVPAGQLDAARDVLKALDQGELQLEDDEGDADLAAPTPILPAPVFNPDRALLLSFLFTPVFFVATQLANALILQSRKGVALRWLALVVMLIASVSVVLIAHQINPGLFVVLRASVMLSGLTLCWYFFFGGQAHSKALIDTYGPRYPRRSLVGPSLIAFAICLAIGWALDRFLV
ncbi:MAG: hypothetical protein WAQ08_02040 [Aquabacterium sp.]|uniref:hypothetical protein n=1 Tax=Aquabacterium sp. TaxID=1872578 RepID=UPI003BB21349